MNQKLYKNIALALILACSTQTSDLQCGWFGSITGQIAAALTGLKTTFQEHQVALYMAITAKIAYYLQATPRPAQTKPVTQKFPGLTPKKIANFFGENCAKKVHGALQEKKTELAESRKRALLKKVENTLEHNKQLDEQIATLKELNEKMDQLTQQLKQAKGETKKVYEKLRRLPFITDQEMRKEYMELLALEQNIQEKKSKANSIAWETYGDFKKAILPKDEIDDHHKKLITFYQRLFRTIVKRDIEKKLAYTVDLGLKIANDGTLTMALRPLSRKECFQQNAFLFMLSKNNCKVLQIVVTNLLQKLYDSRINQSMDSDAFFPEIVLVNDDDETSPTFDKHLSECFAYYNEDTNKIYVRERQLKIKYCREILHEFGHRKQVGMRDAMGGSLSRPIRSEYIHFPYRIALEIDADLSSIEDHPHKKQLQKQLKKEIGDSYKNEDCEAIEESKKEFPYHTQTDLYAITLLNRKCNSNNKLNKIACKLYQTRKINEPNIITKCLKAIESDQNVNSVEYETCIKLIKQSQEATKVFREGLEKIKEAIVIDNKLIEKNNLDYAYERISGCQEYFELKKKFGLIPN